MQAITMWQHHSITLNVPLLVQRLHISIHSPIKAVTELISVVFVHIISFYKHPKCRI